MEILKVAIIGAGSTWTPYTMEGFVEYKQELPFDEIALMDINEQRLKIVANWARRYLEHNNYNTKLTVTTSLEEAVEDCTFIINTIRPGGNEARAQDERLALKLGIIPNEQLGPVGTSFALRTVPVVIEYAKKIAKIAPKSWIFNFTNPQTLITHAMQKYTDAKVIGTDDGPPLLMEEVAKIMGMTCERKSLHKRIRLVVVGSKHAHVIKEIYVDGKPSLREIINRIKPNMPGIHILSNPHNICLMKLYGFIWATYYTDFYFFGDEFFEEIKKLNKVRGETVLELEKKILDEMRDPNLIEKPKTLEGRGLLGDITGTKRHRAGFDLGALPVMNAIYNNTRDILVCGTLNRGAVSDLPLDATVNVSCYVDRSGPHPISVGEVPLPLKGILIANKVWEDLTIEAAITGDYNLAHMAMMASPFLNVHGRYKITKIFLDEILKIHKPYLPQFWKKERR